MTRLHAPKYLVKRGEIYYFRMAIPTDLRSRFGSVEVKTSLKTDDWRLARLRCRYLSNRFERLFMAAETMPELTQDQLGDEMQRDMDLARKILLAVEEADADPRGWVNISVPGYEKQAIYYHIMLLDEAGLLEGQDLCSLGPNGFEWAAKRLTWRGHDFLDAARSDTVWQRAKDKTLKVAGSVTFDVMKELLVQSARELIGLAA